MKKKDYVATLVLEELPKSHIDKNRLAGWLNERRKEIAEMNIEEYAEPYRMRLMRRSQNKRQRK